MIAVLNCTPVVAATFVTSEAFEKTGYGLRGLRTATLRFG
ncbi:hypothetical protein F8B43_2330 [Methylorubrum populi]|uniref:Uncharacterized protein n=1 Tax=Methylorubrum populi TaxID=223967 RepID=A0A833J4F3_9HYPH|nr:hypothetical protein F8B43_2330 [Methylorubrum populi]